MADDVTLGGVADDVTLGGVADDVMLGGVADDDNVVVGLMVDNFTEDDRDVAFGNTGKQAPLYGKIISYCEGEERIGLICLKPHPWPLPHQTSGSRGYIFYPAGIETQTDRA